MIAFKAEQCAFGWALGIVLDVVFFIGRVKQRAFGRALGIGIALDVAFIGRVKDCDPFDWSFSAIRTQMMAPLGWQ